MPSGEVRRIPVLRTLWSQGMRSYGRKSVRLDGRRGERPLDGKKMRKSDEPRPSKGVPHSSSPRSPPGEGRRHRRMVRPALQQFQDRRWTCCFDEESAEKAVSSREGSREVVDGAHPQPEVPMTTMRAGRGAMMREKRKEDEEGGRGCGYL
jgi:hypothetical protein